MYAHFYQLSESPFNLTPDPKFHYVNESTREAIASLLHGIKSRKGFIALIAEAGTGKTTLLRRIVEEVEGETQIVFVFNPGVSFDELLEFICTELGLDTRGCRRLHLIDRLNTYLLEQLTTGRNVVVMIDEAQTLEDSVLEELRLLSNLETSKEKILQIVLSGQPELEEKLRRPGLRQLRQRISVRATLKPVQLSEMQAYVETRLRAAGATRNDLFTPAALKKVWQASGGIPRVINVVCDNAMMIAFADGQKRITPKTLREAMRDLGGDFGQSGGVSSWREWLPRSVGYAVAAAVLVAAAIPLAGVVTRGLERATDAPRIQVAAAPTAADLTEASAMEAASKRRQPVSARTPNDETQLPSGPGSPDIAEGAAAVATLPDAFEAPEEGGTDFVDEAGPLDGEDDGRAALNSDATMRQPVLDSIRRAEIIARSTAARLYDKDRNGPGGSRDLAGAALDEIENARGASALGASDPAPADAERAAPVPLSDETVLSDAVAAELEPKIEKTTGKANAASAAISDSIAEAPKPERRAVILDAARSEAPAKVPTALTNVAEHTAPKAERAKPVSTPEAVVKAPRAAEDTSSPIADPVSAETSTKRREAPVTAAVAEPTAPLAEVILAVPALGQSVVVKDGDTVWDISIEYYGEAGPAVLTRILGANRGIRDPLKLEVGSTVFLPFNRPDQMVSHDATGYRVLLASGPTPTSVADVEAWARTFAGQVELATAKSQGQIQHLVYVVGLASESAAIGLATGLLDRAPSPGSAQRTAMR
jgi:general secretion pathway protein A